MTVLLVGVGADGENVDPAPHFDEQGRYEYLPIPETWPTAEEETYGSFELDHQSGRAMKLIERIRPGGKNGEWIEDPDEVAEHPVHHDPNFEALTFGDKRSGWGTGSEIVKHLRGGDDPILGFYKGIRDQSGHLNRYLYGYFTVDGVHDLTSFVGEEYRSRLLEFPDNAHTKRLRGAGEPKHDDVVIVDGKQPADLLKYPVQLGERIADPPYYETTDEFVTEFEVEGGHKAVSRKPPIKLSLSTDEFRKKIEEKTP